MTDVNPPTSGEVSATTALPTLFKVSALILALMAVAFLRLHCSPIPAVITGHADNTQPVQVMPGSVKFSDKKTKQLSKIDKPLEGSVTYLPDGTVQVQNIGLTFIPKFGGVYVLGSGFQLYGGARVLFASSWGAEVGGNDLRAFVGLDVRDPVLNLMTTSAGVTSPWVDLFKPSFYAGEAFTLAI